MLEPFITPALYQRYADAGAIDEWTISTLMTADGANGGLAQLEHHYDTFIVRQPTLELTSGTSDRCSLCSLLIGSPHLSCAFAIQSEQDFAEIAGAGLNWVRIPIPFWAIDVWEGEPFLPRTCWKYILRAFQWARKYGLRVAIDLHSAPGSQNGASDLLPPHGVPS